MQKPTRIQKKHRRLKRLLSFLLILAIMVLLTSFSLNSSFFNISKINIKGISNLNRDNILHTSSINIGENIFRVSTRDAEENILQLPYTKSVTVKRSLPNNINIEITEREDKLLVRNISSYFLIDDEGFILNQIDTNLESLPVVFGLKTDKIDIGDNLFSNLEIEEFEEFVKVSLDLDILSKIERLELNSEENVKILINNGIDVAFGSLNNVEYKLRLLSEILDNSKDNEIVIKRILMDRGEHPIVVVDE